MAQEKGLMVFDQGLPLVRGWSKLSAEKKERIQRITSDVKKFGAMEDFGLISAGLRLLDAERELEGEELTLTTYLKTVYGASERSGWRRLKRAKRLNAKWPADLVRAIAEKGSLLLRGVAGIGVEDLIRVAEELPAPKKLDDRTVDAFIEGPVRLKLYEHKSIRRAGKQLRLDEEDGMRHMFNNDRRIMRAMRKNSTSADRRQVLKTVVGWLMEDFAIPGALECKRISIPEGTVAKVGRPRKAEQVA